MRKLFPGYYRPTEEEFRDLWSNCVFIFDTNVLLNTYRYSPKTTEKVFRIFSTLQERLWIPYQVAKEFLDNRLDVISGQTDAYDEVIKKLESVTSNLNNELGKYRKHPFIDISQIISSISHSIEDLTSDVRNVQNQHPNLIEEDVLWQRITDLFEDRVGLPLSPKEYQDKQKEAEQRFAQKIPPGYEDTKNKQGSEKYGDALLWFQMLGYAQAEKRAIIFVTGDTKKDWWLKHKGRIIGPRPELLQEMHDKAGVNFHIYQTERFIDQAQKFLGIESEPEIIEEIENIRREQESIYVIKAAPFTIDTDGDGTDEIIIQSQQTNQIIEIYKTTPFGLTMSVVEPVSITAPYLENAQLIDIDADGQREIVIFVGWDTGMGLVFYKYQNDEYKILKGVAPKFFDNPVHCFVDAKMDDIDNDGKLEVVSEPFWEIPEDLVPEEYQKGELDSQRLPWGRTRYIWKWNYPNQHFVLIHREIMYIGGR